MKQVWKDRSFRLSILLTFLFFGTGIAFLFPGIADYSWVLFVLLPVVPGVSTGAVPNKKYTLTGTVMATVVFLLGL